MLSRVISAIRIRKLIPSSFTFMASVYLLTFFVILPRTCRHLPYSVYFEESLAAQLQTAIHQHQQRVDSETDYFVKMSRQHRHEYTNRLMNNTNEVIVVVVTSQRTVANVGSGYLTQVMAAFDRILRSGNDFRHGVAIFMCNIDGGRRGHEEALWLADYFPMISRFPDSDARTVSIQNPEKQREDYIFCLNATLRYAAKYVLMVEDDAVPKHDFFSVMDHVLDQKISRIWRRGELVANEEWAYVKFYYPDRWRSYGSDIMTTLEVAATGLLGGAATLWLTLFTSSRFPFHVDSIAVFISASIYFGLISVLIGRPHVQQWRRISPDLYTAVSAPECCIPSVLYPKSVIGELIGHLTAATCRSDPVDIVIDRYFARKSYARYLIEPNLFKHRGMYSSIKGMSVHPGMFLD
ncbi:hypothetical protein LSH36_39g11022 [Paralvinella palmiformis]|uniref:Uncharacterized protein n=1 Tax=Paralvinella palmiformis TaxID=53620 RepID=A0AAD9K7F7_9ANNE|nr:hypothetical protein LSH36_39g11022 [Paralvinella palmiformis]